MLEALFRYFGGRFRLPSNRAPAAESVFREGTIGTSWEQTTRALFRISRCAHAARWPPWASSLSDRWPTPVARRPLPRDHRAADQRPGAAGASRSARPWSIACSGRPGCRPRGCSTCSTGSSSRRAPTFCSTRGIRGSRRAGAALRRLGGFAAHAGPDHPGDGLVGAGAVAARPADAGASIPPRRA